MSLDRLFGELRPEVARILDAALSGRELSVDDAELLLGTEGAELQALQRAADVARAEDKGDDVSFVVCRNINFTNICYVGCTFCGFSRHKDEEDAYDHPMEALLVKAKDAVARGATEVCIQGGIHPNKDHTHYREILEAIKGEFPDLHIHAFSPEEIDFGHKKSGMELSDYLRWLVDAGLGSMPGTAAEILDDELRRVLAPRKLDTARWVEIVKAAHGIGLRSTSTLMYGHLETQRHVANHLGLLRDIQQETGGFTEFVPLGFIHERNTLFNHMHARPGSSAPEDLRLIAVARLFLRPGIQNIQVSWVKLGRKLSQIALMSGANDFGGTLMEESISRESGSDHGENLPQEEMRRLIREIGRTPVERSTEYGILRRFDDPIDDPPSLEPKIEPQLSGPARQRLANKKVPAANS
ncbi:MAG: 5-amino-6-(D-ribitylamino)uracil--L-tyrosine 4-hydroxyphenyl transferase CofH [Deltaproteobacteria bacterium]|nr:5-amino-6-(D-ribitylamino)uracil--L-tyrosine 4-hydroxyphenyl transferase CofH [Deltaproteobacteria bacterium]MBW2359548.1 5-amino-6-(D-ribitylamino)uracil--L-tyrosine 4-hydroxyphenyl transferase CofH [Deltaproteobacteria bacterium]